MNRKQYHKEYYQKHKDKMLERTILWKKKHCDRFVEYSKIYRKTLTFRYAAYKYSAKIRGLKFDINFVKFEELINRSCVYCGNAGYGIDRIDSNTGYIKGNIVSCCSMCNRMKSDYTIDEFIDQCIKISEYTIENDK